MVPAINAAVSAAKIFAVSCAVFAAMLAREGFTGPTAVFEGKGGLFEAVGRFEWPLPALDGTRYIERTHFKCFPICYHGQTAVWAALDARPQIGTRAIAKIELETYKSAVEIDRKSVV